MSFELAHPDIRKCRLHTILERAVERQEMTSLTPNRPISLDDGYSIDNY
jgi:hypothetical protein